MSDKIEVCIVINKKRKGNPEDSYEFKLQIDKPDPTLVDDYSKMFEKYKKYTYEENLDPENYDNMLREKILEKYFRVESKDNSSEENKIFVPTKNKDISDVLVKVTLLNDYYRTRINNDFLVSIARQIVALNVDDRLKSGKTDVNLVNEIAYRRDAIQKENDIFPATYSFATKYCSWHRPDLYPIADSYSKGMLYYINEKENFFDYNKITSYNTKVTSLAAKTKFLNDYENYLEVYDKFIEKFGLKDLDYKTIDQYLWMYAQKNLEDLDCTITKNGETIIDLETYNEENKNDKKRSLADLIKISSEHYDKEHFGFK